MENVNFQCGHCGKLMAVGTDHLGQQVRCPHCQQVVIAPVGEAPAPPAPVIESSPTPVLEAPASPAEATAPTPEFHVPSPTEQESIFSEPAETGDDLFGAEPVSHVEMPPEPAVPQLQIEELASPTAPKLADEMLPAPSPLGDVTATFEMPVVALPPESAHTNGASDPALGSANLWSTPTAVSTQAASTIDPSSTELPPSLTTPTVRMPQASRPWLLPLFIIPLISYSVLMTIAVGILYLRLQQQVHPLEALPDQGDNKGATHGKSSSSLQHMPNPDQDLPPKLRVELGHPLRIGDIEVTPTKIEHRRIQFQLGAVLDPTKQETLALELRLRNVSDDVYFKPLDPYFNRLWNPNKQTGMMPYGFLAMDNRHFFGPIDWQPRNQNRMRMLVLGQDLDKELKPGEEMTTFLCTDPQDPVLATLKRAKGPFLWRVQVRRGLVKVGDKEVSATAVVGVQFNKQDVQ
jgi:DNA-directed RNA polymerase subunit RPC12/RpoP